MEEKFDFIILGQGSAAFAAAIKANDLGIKTAMVGGNATPGTVVGGTCVNVGCMPSKRLITVSTLLYNGTNHSFEGISYGKGKVNFQKVVAQKDALVRKFRKEKYADVLKNMEHVTYYEATGKFVSNNEVRVGNKVLRGEKFLVATGARANVPPIRGLENIDYLTNEEALSLGELPTSLVVAGGRSQGLEFAQMYAHFGANVTVLQRSERILPEDEPEVSEAMRKYLEDEGVKIHTAARINAVKKNGKMKIVNVTVGKRTFDIECEQLLFATGRKANTEDLDLEKAGVKTADRGFIVVNDEMQTSAAHVWAAGDVIGEPMLETAAAKEGATAVGNAFAEKRKKINFNEIPAAVFTYPEVARVGLTDEEANAKGIKCTCNTLPMDLVPKAHVIGDTRGLVKLVVSHETKQIVGVSIVAPHAADIIHEAVLAVKHKLTIDDIIDTVHVFPTLSEGIKLAAQSFYKDVGQLSCCTE